MPAVNVTRPSPEALMYLPTRRHTDKEEEEKQPVPSVMNVLLKMELTSEGRPMLRSNEVEVYRDENISLYDHARKTEHQAGWCCVTTYRIIYIDHTISPPKAIYLPLGAVIDVSKEAKFLTRSAKLRIDFGVNDVTVNKMFIKLSFKEGGRDEFYNPLMAALDRRAWQDLRGRGICLQEVQLKQRRALSS